MGNIFTTPQVRTNTYGKNIVTLKQPDDFKHLVGLSINEIILFENGSDELLEQGRIILPRHYFIFVGNKNGEPQLKPYEYNQYRIVVNTYNDTITNIDSIG